VGAIKFCLSNLDISTVIPGIRSIRQAEENCSASDGKFFNSEEMAVLKKHRLSLDQVSSLREAASKKPIFSLQYILYIAKTLTKIRSWSEFSSYIRAGVKLICRT
jgi:hypothetical protein